MIFQLSTFSGAVAVACSPRHRFGDTSPLLYADLLDFQTRADIRIRIRSIVIRIRIRHTAIRIRIVVPAIDHTDYREALPITKVLISRQKKSIMLRRITITEQQKHRQTRLIPNLSSPNSLHAACPSVPSMKPQQRLHTVIRLDLLPTNLQGIRLTDACIGYSLSKNQ